MTADGDLYELLRRIDDKLDRLLVRDGKAKPAPRPVAAGAGSKWGHDEDEALRHQYAAGDTVEQMATAHGRSPGAIRSRLQKIGFETDVDREFVGGDLSLRTSS